MGTATHRMNKALRSRSLLCQSLSIAGARRLKTAAPNELTTRANAIVGADGNPAQSQYSGANGNSVPHLEPRAKRWRFIRARVAKGIVLHADEAGSWDNLHERFEVKRINHQEAYSLDGACTNWAKEYFSRLRRAKVGIHHHIAGAYLPRWAQESSWREDNRCQSNGEQVNRIALRSQ